MLQWLRQNVRGHVVGWGDSRWPIGKPLVWGPQASTAEEKRGWGFTTGQWEPFCSGETEVGMPRRWRKDAFNSGNHDNQTKPAGRRHIANVLLEFMHKSNNTKRKETWGDSQRKQPHNAASVVSVFSKSGNANKPTNIVALHKHKTLRFSYNPPRTHTHINPKNSGWAIRKNLRQNFFESFFFFSSSTRKIFALQNSWHTQVQH